MTKGHIISVNNWTREVREGLSGTRIVYYPQYGYYESNLMFTVPGDSLSLALQGEHGEDLVAPPSPACQFDVDNYYNDSVPYDTLRNHHYSIATALEIGGLSYSSPSCGAAVTLASNAAGTEVNFAFKSNSTNETIPHRLVYFCSVGAAGDIGNDIVVTNNRKSFYTFYDAVGPPSPMEGTLGGGHYLDAKLKLYLDPSSHYPTSGEYTSTIYVLLERHQ